MRLPYSYSVPELDLGNTNKRAQRAKTISAAEVDAGRKILQEMIRFNGGPTDWDVRCKHEQGVRLTNQEYAEKQREQMSETKGDLIKRREACTQTEPHTDAAYRGKNRMEEAEAGHRA